VTARHSAVVIVGAGPAGLATSRCLSDRAVDHVIIERGRVAHSWRTQRWDSLRLLTPNWMNQLPGEHGGGIDPDGYLTADALVHRLVGYRQNIDAPVFEHVAVTGLRRAPSGLVVDTDHGWWRAAAVVVATGAAQTPHIPAVAAALPAGIAQLHALRYRNPAQLRSGDVLVVGASASGVQIADELQRAGHAVTLAVGDHVRLPRTYRGRDIYWWMHTIGLLDERHDTIDDLARARRLPSAQLIGTNEQRTLDLNHLHAAGVRITGKLAAIKDRRALFSGSLANLSASADLKLHRLLERIDAHIADHRRQDVGPVERPPPTDLPAAVTDIRLDRFDTVIWATGYRANHRFIDAELLDRHGRLRHHGGVTEVPGLYVLGLPVTRRRSSGLIAGIGADAVELTDRLVEHLADKRNAA
jgi:putative flavoprotein involved in K+ transport